MTLRPRRYPLHPKPGYQVGYDAGWVAAHNTILDAMERYRINPSLQRTLTVTKLRTQQ